MQKSRIIREALIRALESYRGELAHFQEQVAEMTAKITALEEELHGHSGPRGQGARRRRGKGVPFSTKDVTELEAHVADVNVSGKKPLEAARLIYHAAGKPLHAALVYQVLASKGWKINAKRRPEDVFASYLRRSKVFEKVERGVFRLKAGTSAKG